MSDQKLPKATPAVGKEGRAARRALAVGGCVALMGAGALSAATPALAGYRFGGANIPAQTAVASAGGVVPIRLVCPRGTVKSCAGTLSLRTQKKVGGKIRTLGSARFSIGSGKSAKVKLKLNPEGKRLLGKGKISPIAVAFSHDGQNHKVTRSRKIELESHAYYENPPPVSSY